jgi:hypothetical protein
MTCLFPMEEQCRAWDRALQLRQRMIPQELKKAHDANAPPCIKNKQVLIFRQDGIRPTCHR